MNVLKAAHGRIVQRYDQTHSQLDLNVISPSMSLNDNVENSLIDLNVENTLNDKVENSLNDCTVENTLNDLDVENTEIFVSHRWAPHEETTTETKRPSRVRTARVVSNIKSMGDIFVAEAEDDRHSSGSRKRPGAELRWQ